MGGTGPDSQPLGFADQVFFSDGNGNPLTPPAANIYNPDPKAGTLNQYTQRAQWFNCNDTTQPGIAAITNYLNSLPYAVDPKCGPGEYWQAVNVNPAFTPKPKFHEVPESIPLIRSGIAQSSLSGYWERPN
jgi:phospholipase C